MVASHYKYSGRKTNDGEGKTTVFGSHWKVASCESRTYGWPKIWRKTALTTPM